MIDPTLLYVSDDPETFVGRGKLFFADLPADGRVARILFDHVNGAATPMRVIAMIANKASVPNKIALAGVSVGPPGTPSPVGPNDPFRNGMHVGHLATAGFLKARLVVPGGSIDLLELRDQPHLLASFVLDPGAKAPTKMDGQCAAGIWNFLSISGLPCEFRVMACDVGEDATAWDTLQPAENKRMEENEKAREADPNVPRLDFRSGIFDISGREGFDNAENEITLDGSPGKLGDATYPRAANFPQFDGSAYKGEYGVIKHFWCEMGDAANGRLTQEARGNGSATASYLTNDELLESGQFGRGRVFSVADVSPGEDGVARVVTMAEINSTLPVNLGITRNAANLATVSITRSPALIAQGAPPRSAPVA
jgi:hypothetical protein